MTARRRPAALPATTTATAAIAIAVVFALLTAACSSGSSGGGPKAVGAPPTTDVTGQAPGAAADRAVDFVNGTMQLAGTLSTPATAAGAKASAAGVLFIPDIGAGDRNGPISPQGEPDTIAADLSQAFVGAGMVTLRYDRRGTGESKPVPSATAGASTTVPADSFTFEDLVADAKSGLDLLSQRKETAGAKLTVVGYGEGGLVALRLAATDPKVSRVVLVSTPGRPLVDVQANRLSASYGSVSGDALHTAVTGLLSTGTLPALESLRSELRPLLPASQAPFLAQLYRIDPSAEAAKVTAPVMVVNGSASTGVGTADAANFVQSLGSRVQVVVASNADESLDQVLPPPLNDPSDPNSVNHEHGAAAPSTVGPRDPPAVSAVASWISGVAGKGS